MILLQVNNVSKYFGSDIILSNIKLEVQTNDRVAIVGRNGAGKSTLLKIIAGDLSYDGGEINKPKDVTVGYLAQNSGLQSDKTIWEEYYSVFNHLVEMQENMRRLELKMTQEDVYSNQAVYDKIMNEYDHLQYTFKENGGYQFEADIRSIISGLGFSNEDYQTKISSLSGGQKTRLALGKLLLTKPDLLILDEPTNHLDIDTLSWLERYLQSYPGAVLIVSHDRYFLDQVVNIVYEISNHKHQRFVGNYSKYLDLKAAQYEQELKQFEKQQEEIAKLEDFVQRNIARASTTKRAQSRRKQLDRMVRIDKPLGDDSSANFSFTIEKQSGNDVLSVQDLFIGYNRIPTINQTMKFVLNRGDSVALVGPNGVGKSTLLKTIIGDLEKLQGTIDFGANVSVGYYDQEQAKLTSNKRVLDELWDDYPLKPEQEIRTILGNFLFSGDDVTKIVTSLSGGEKARLALAKLMMKKANFLILDEPTNHLDLDSKEVLENALLDYPGTILFVSHDRYFMNRLSTKTFELAKEGLTIYLGDYDYYRFKKNEAFEKAQAEKEATLEQVKQSSQPLTDYQQDKELKKKLRQTQRRIEEIESNISQFELDIETIELELCKPEVYGDFQLVQELTSKKNDIETKLIDLMEEWENLQE
ncbi:ABC-F family ATP-binding cassette domain-containing protein [Bacillus sp. AFS041924]|uniref:ABC-F family ATP-binding cassette domain-containing protein n=1 Tax=Bacillus sp. AFS041924 TaxID=2033503 RepID=UPI000BFCC87C|nr:ABC-F family ATP-binding cassette domain-containing protein [Bacillus sp. AFS041924]PGS50512.1 ABC transporter ATP-binding protein [Bacillus sp. AFS041924]